MEERATTDDIKKCDQRADDKIEDFKSEVQSLTA